MNRAGLPNGEAWIGVPTPFRSLDQHVERDAMPLVGWIVALIGFIGIILSVAPVIDLPPQLQFSPGVWGGVMVVGLLIAMFTRRGKD